MHLNYKNIGGSLDKPKCIPSLAKCFLLFRARCLAVTPVHFSRFNYWSALSWVQTLLCSHEWKINKLWFHLLGFSCECLLITWVWEILSYRKSIRISQRSWVVRYSSSSLAHERYVCLFIHDKQVMISF